MVGTNVIWGDIPESLLAADQPAMAAELFQAREIRMKFLPIHWPEPYLNNVVRAFRIAAGAQSYLEVSSRDKGHLAWMSSVLAPNATIVDVDVIHFEDNEQLLRSYILKQQKLIRVVADPHDPNTPAMIRQRVKTPLFDVVFANYASFYNDAISEVSQYYQFVKPGGALIVNDAYWEGDESRKGKCQALTLLNATHPIYCVHMEAPIHRFVPREQRGGEWGTLAIIPRPATDVVPGP